MYSLYVAINREIRVTIGLRREVDEICTLLGYYAAYSSNSLPTYLGNLSVPFQGLRISRRPLKTGPIGFSETSVRNCHYTLRNNPVERGSQLRNI